MHIYRAFFFSEGWKSVALQSAADEVYNGPGWRQAANQGQPALFRTMAQTDGSWSGRRTAQHTYAEPGRENQVRLRSLLLIIAEFIKWNW